MYHKHLSTNKHISSNRRHVRHGYNNGYALVASLVVTVVLFTVAAGLAQMRRLAQVAAEKHLASTVALATLDARARMLRYDIASQAAQIAASTTRSLPPESTGGYETVRAYEPVVTSEAIQSGVMSVNTLWHPPNSNVPSLANDIRYVKCGSGSDNDMGWPNQPTYSAKLVMPDAGEDGTRDDVYFQTMMRQNQLGLTQQPLTVSGFDPWRGARCVPSSYVFAFRREPIGRTTSFAWDNVSVATRANIMVRALPASVFTIMAQGANLSVSTNMTTTSSIRIIQNDGVGLGRLYAGAKLTFNDGGTLYHPAVAQKFKSPRPGSQLTIIPPGGARSAVWPSDTLANEYAGQTDAVWATYDDKANSELTRNRHTAYQGMLCSIRTPPSTRLIIGAPQISSNMTDPRNIVARMARAADVEIRIRSGAYNPDVSLRKPDINTPNNHDAIANAVILNRTVNEVAVNVATVRDVLNNTPVTLAVISEDTSVYWVRVTGYGPMPMTVVSPNLLVVDGQWNSLMPANANGVYRMIPSSEEVPSALVAPYIYAKRTKWPVVHIQASITTMAGSPHTSIKGYNAVASGGTSSNPIGVHLKGALMSYVTEEGWNGNLPLTIEPVSRYITGEWIPPLVPVVCVLDTPSNHPEHYRVLAAE